ncbi:hypothetical protein [Halarcobacter sp.]|uniref:hypothetical protein n=1 Tax=Halarcobacter sp. TaxID=2321133 RepID=UPI0029F4C2E4|nr:hypothetical protein [Halarcobacter sp.]
MSCTYNYKYEKSDIYMDIYKNPDEKWKDIIVNNPEMRNRITVNELELSSILGQGASVSTLSTLRSAGKQYIEYIQIKKRSRVLYPLINICEFTTEMKIANKHDWLVRQIKKSDYLELNSNIINQNTIAKILGVKPGTIIEYRKEGLFIEPIKVKGTLFLIDNLVSWVLKNSIKCV